MGIIRSKKQMSVSVENDSLKGKVDKLAELVTSLTSRISSLENNVEALKNSRSKWKGSKDKTKPSGSVESSAPQKSIYSSKQTTFCNPTSIFNLFKLPDYSSLGSDGGQPKGNDPCSINLVGCSNETFVSINREKVNALIDSGSMVTTLSESFFTKLSPTPELCVKGVKGANDASIPYCGYAVLSLSVPNFSSETVTVPVLVVNNTDYSASVPLIIGTNILSYFKLNGGWEVPPCFSLVSSIFLPNGQPTFSS